MSKFMTIFLLCLGFVSNAQKGDVIFGLQYRPIVPSSVFGDDQLNVENDDLTATVDMTFSNSFGMIIRKNFTDHWSLETSINHIKRTFKVNSILKSDEEETIFDISSVSYELPVEALYYVQLGDDLYMNALAGGSFNIFPSQLFSLSDDNIISAKAARKSWLGISLLANIGVEYRTKSSGYFYLGASLHRPLNIIYQIQVDYRLNTQINNSAVGFINGNFLSIDLRYFFAPDDEKKSSKK